MSKVKVKTEEGYWKRFGKYFVKNWQLYIIFLLPALLMTIIFKYLPMLGIIIAFEEYSPIKGYFGSDWIGLYNFKRLFSSTEFGRLLLNTLKLSGYELLPADYFSASALQGTEGGAAQKGPACGLSALLYFHHRTGRYGETVLFPGRPH